MTTSIWPLACSSRNRPAPVIEPKMPPTVITAAILKSTPSRRMCAIAPETLAPVICDRRRGDGDGRRDAVEDQQRRGQEAAADAEHPRQHADHSAQPDDEQGVDRLFRDGEVNVHRRTVASGKARAQGQPSGKGLRLRSRRRASASVPMPGSGAAGDALAIVDVRADVVAHLDRHPRPGVDAVDARLVAAPRAEAGGDLADRPGG